ncbi:uncharacterized protein LOC134766096 [Penaeus indicus]|uniref:uncharacterized protein LOC134766096 n=1 Tax=Penaeus indicus TaxID=29960 RepID=UPI00300D830F
MKQEETLIKEAASTPASQEEGKEEDLIKKEEEEKEVNEIKKEEENKQEASSRSLSDDETSDGRSLYRGGVSRRGLLHRDDLPPKVIVTSSVNRGQLLDDTYAQDRTPTRREPGANQEANPSPQTQNQTAPIQSRGDLKYGWIMGISTIWTSVF